MRTIKSCFGVGVLGAGVWMALLVMCGSLQAQGILKDKEHENLAAFEGRWDLVMKTSDGSEFKGDCDFKMTCGGLWLMSDVDVDFGSERFLGRGMDGYDPETKEYVSVWVDSMSTVPLTFRGKYDESTKKLVMTGAGKGVDGKGKALWTMVATIDNSDRHETAMYVTPEGGEKSHVVTTIYTRRK